MRTPLALTVPLLVISLACGGLGAPGPDEAPAREVAAEVATEVAPTAPRTLEDLLELELEDRDAIEARFGDAVSTVEILENEAGMFEHAAIHVGTPREVIFYNDGVMVRRPDSEWTSTTGLRGGLPLAELEALNGGPFTLQGTPEGLQATELGGGTLEGRFLSVYLGKDGDLYPELEGRDDLEAIRSDTVHEAGLTVHLLVLY